MENKVQVKQGNLDMVQKVIDHVYDQDVVTVSLPKKLRRKIKKEEKKNEQRRKKGKKGLGREQ